MHKIGLTVHGRNHMSPKPSPRLDQNDGNRMALSFGEYFSPMNQFPCPSQGYFLSCI